MTPRDRLIETIEREVRETASWTGRYKLVPKVRDALHTVRREAFVPEAARPEAYDNRPLGIGHGQTISQPFIVALMTDLLDPQPDHLVLEVGTGSGYQAAVLAALVRHVYSVEIIRNLSEQASAALKAEVVANVSLRVGDGAVGWLEHAPYDGIIVTAAAEQVPPALVAQLRPGGRMVIPVGTQSDTQELTVISKNRDGTIATREILPVLFVPLT
jgi:protein-L-isoaspartate(D-aspartate) O-methyltransferase